MIIKNNNKIKNLRKIILCLILLTVSCSYVLAAEPSPEQITKDNLSDKISNLELRLNTIESKSADNIYKNILEKTNQQLSLWFNPYALIVAILGIFFAILAIVAAVAIYRQSRDYKRKLKIDSDKYQEQFDKFLESQKKCGEEIAKKTDNLIARTEENIEEYKKKLASATKEQKEEIQKVIDDLNNQKISIESIALSASAPVVVAPSTDDLGSYLLGDKHFHRCSKCSFGFKIKNEPKARVFSFQKYVTCPSCGNTDEI